MLLIGDQASDQDWLLNLPETKDKGALRFFFSIPYRTIDLCREETTQEEK